MVCSETSFSPTTVYKHFPWLQELLSKADGNEAPSTVPAAVSEAKTNTQQAAEIASLKKTVALLQAENHQLAQANVALEERMQGADSARQAAINSCRRLKLANGSAATPIRN